MKKRQVWIKKVIILISLFFALILAVFLLIRGKNTALEVIFIDIGQGDSTLIKAPNGEIIIIDGGPDNKVLRRLGENIPFYRRYINFLIISHYHEDHIIGFIELIKRYRVKTLIYSGKPADSIAFNELLKVAARYGVEPMVLEKQGKLSFGDNCSLNILNPDILGVKDDANNSLTARLDCKDKSFLFAGDNNASVEKALILSGWPIKADIFKASHHGSNTSNSEDFLEKIGADLVVVPVGQDNRFGHPGNYFLERVKHLDMSMKRTDIDGSIKIFTK